VRDDGSSQCDEKCKLLSVRRLNSHRVFWVNPLNEPLEYPQSRLIWNFDEKPIFPDSPVLKTIETNPVAAGRSAIWTIGIQFSFTFLSTWPIYLYLFFLLRFYRYLPKCRRYSRVSNGDS
jgi:hypothetical protein